MSTSSLTQLSCKEFWRWDISWHETDSVPFAVLRRWTMG